MKLRDFFIDEEVSVIFKVISAILHLGNIVFTTQTNDYASVESEATQATIANLLR